MVTKKKKSYIFLEVGTHSLKKTNEFYYSNHKFTDLPNKEWKIYLFEPNPFRIPLLKKEILLSDIPNIIFYPKAVLDYNGKTNLFLGNNKTSESSTLFKRKRLHINYNNVEEVECIDFDKWIRNNLQKEDYIYMHMDIEGAEYIVLPEMIKKGSIHYINKMDIELHFMKFKGEVNLKFEKIHNKIREFFDTFNEKYKFHFIKIRNRPHKQLVHYRLEQVKNI